MSEIANDSAPRKPLWRRSRWGIFLAVVFVGVFVTLLVPYLICVRTEALRMGCVHNMKHILLALHSYHDRYETFPPAYTVDADGKRLHSWRVLILSHLGEEELYKQIRLDEPWDSEHNSRLHKQMPTIFCCPADRKKQSRGETSYIWVLGKSHISDGTSCTKITDIHDGTSNTIMLVETLDPCCWMAPEDTSIGDLWENWFEGSPPSNGISSNHTCVGNLGFADGSVRTLDHYDLYVIMTLSTIAGGETLIGAALPIMVEDMIEKLAADTPAGKL